MDDSGDHAGEVLEIEPFCAPGIGMARMMSHCCRRSAAAVYAAVLISASIAASLPALAQDRLSENGIPAKSIAAILPEHGDSDGSRKALAARGITYEWNYIGEWQTNVAGGISQGSIYIGRLEGVIDVDLAKLMV